MGRRNSSMRNGSNNNGNRRKSSSDGEKTSKFKSKNAPSPEAVYNDGIAARTRSAPRMVICPSALHTPRSGMDEIYQKTTRTPRTRSRSPAMGTSSASSTKKEDITPQENGAQMKDDPRLREGASSSTKGQTRPRRNGLEKTQEEPEGGNQEPSETAVFRGKRKLEEHPNMKNNTKNGNGDNNEQDLAAQASASTAEAIKSVNGTEPNGDHPKSQVEVFEMNAKVPKEKSITTTACIGQGYATEDLDVAHESVEVGQYDGATKETIDEISRKENGSITESGGATSSTATQHKSKKSLITSAETNGNKTKERETELRHHATRPVEASYARAIVQAMETMTIASLAEDSEYTQAKRALKKKMKRTAKELSATRNEEMASDALHCNISVSENGSPQNLGCGAGKDGRQRVGFRANGDDSTETSFSCEERVRDLVSNDEGPLSASGTSVPSTEVCHTTASTFADKGGPVSASDTSVASAVDNDAASTPTKEKESKSDAHPSISEAGDRSNPREQQTVEDPESIGDSSVAYWEIVSVRQTKVLFRHQQSVGKSKFPVSNSGEVAAGNDTAHTRSRKRLAEVEDQLLEKQPNGKLGKKMARKDSNGENGDIDGSPENRPSHGVNSSRLRSTMGQSATSESEPSSSISRRIRSSQTGSQERPLSPSADLSRRLRMSSRSRTAADANDIRLEQPENDEDRSQNPSSHGDEMSNWKPLDQIAGVGINRIRITPLLETRTHGSVGHHIVQKLLVQYGVLERVEGLDPEEDSKQGRATESLEMDESYGLGNSDAFSKETNPPKELERSTAKKPVEPVTDELVHDYKLPPKQAYRSGRLASRQALPPILLDATDTNNLPKSLQHLDPDAKVDILNRKTGRVLSGGNAVAVKDLPNLLKYHSSYEPIVPPPSSGKELSDRELNVFVREARSSTRSRVCGSVQRQNAPNRADVTGGLIMITAGPNKGMMGALEKVLPGGWSVVKLQYPCRGPKIVVDSDHLTNLERSDNRSDSRIVLRGKCSAKSLDAVFMNAYKKAKLS